MKKENVASYLDTEEWADSSWHIDRTIIDRCLVHSIAMTRHETDKIGSDLLYNVLSYIFENPGLTGLEDELLGGTELAGDDVIKDALAHKGEPVESVRSCESGEEDLSGFLNSDEWKRSKYYVKSDYVGTMLLVAVIRCRHNLDDTQAQLVRNSLNMGVIGYHMASGDEAGITPEALADKLFAGTGIENDPVVIDGISMYGVRLQKIA